jgi:diguanylate cyclase (GGDEF)-like protein/PAS domain S-box-containing protein
VLEQLPAYVYVKDLAGCYTFANEAFLHFLQLPLGQILGRSEADFFPPPIAQDMREKDRQLIAQGCTVEQELYFTPPGDAQPRCFWVVRQPVRDDRGQVVAICGVATDITGRKQAEQALQQSESMLRAIVDNTPLQYWARDLEGRCIMQNAQVVHQWGDLLGMRPQDSAISPEALQIWQANNRRAYAGEVVEEEVAYTVDGQLRHYLNVIAPIRVDGSVAGIVGFNQDITDRKRADAQIRSLAFYDPLTHLPNRRLMFDRLAQALVGSARRRRQGALLLIDLDNFKLLNDTRGHEAGDQLLLAVAQRLQACIRQGDTAARLGGDEFVVILEDIDGSSEGALQAELLGQTILARLSEPYELRTVSHAFGHHCTSSIGITLFKGNEVAAEELLRRSDTALYQAKASGRNALRFYDPLMQEAMAARAVLEADLRRSLAQGHFALHYQPQVHVQAGITGAEALVRWHHPERGLVLPGEFITLAEEANLIRPLGEAILRQACEQLALWAQDPQLAHLTLSVNVSARQLHHPAFVERLRNVFDETGADPGRLKIELTESVLLERTDAVIERLLELKTLGLGFSLDDFGTGYSSLVYLKHLPIDQLKIDRSFVRDVMSDPNDAVIARTIVALANSLGLAVIAEGVETEAQRDFLVAHGCLAYQGYLYGRPMVLGDFLALVREGQGAPELA